MFGQIALSFKQNFVDPYDKPGTRAKTYDRVLQFMIHTIFNQGQDVADNGCAISMIEILTNVFPELL